MIGDRRAGYHGLWSSLSISFYPVKLALQFTGATTIASIITTILTSTGIRHCSNSFPFPWEYRVSSRNCCHVTGTWLLLVPRDTRGSSHLTEQYMRCNEYCWNFAKCTRKQLYLPTYIISLFWSALACYSGLVLVYGGRRPFWWLQCTHCQSESRTKFIKRRVLVLYTSCYIYCYP